MTTLYALYDVDKEVRKRAEKDLVQEAGKHRMAEVLRTTPFKVISSKI